MDCTEEQKKFYESFENLSPDAQEAMLCEAKECVKNTGFNDTLSLIHIRPHYEHPVLIPLEYQNGEFRTV